MAVSGDDKALTCPSCGSRLPEAQRFCGACGAAIVAHEQQGTMTVQPIGHVAVLTPPPSRYSTDRAGFLPGTILAGRYRMIGLLGRGGMGEVYRADDLKLGQPVALKFLPRDVERDPVRQERFLAEVRLSLRVTHPNVCRVFDIGETEGRHFLSMEYVDGEDLASLLRRIGRLPEDKAIEIARQLCAGLAAAHDEGVLHRDLKPANIMIDGRGRAKITDFGLAGATEGIAGEEARVGTPQYMAPEQLAGKSLSHRTDLYALGLVLYELFTGKRAFDARDLDELARLHGSAPTNPSVYVAGIDPAVERAILRCLDPDPGRRPASASSVATSLPGGDPLAMALAAGETPSPDMVAAAGERAGMKSWQALACFAAVIVGLVAAAWLADKGSAVSAVPMQKTPEAMAEHARQVLGRLGHRDTPASESWDFAFDRTALASLAPLDRATGRQQVASARPPAIYFWYRRSPERMVPLTLYEPRIDESDPPMVVRGMVRLRLDAQGRLCSLFALPREEDVGTGAVSSFDWRLLFQEAGLDMSKFAPVEPVWTPDSAFDTRAAWRESSQRDPLRAEAAAWRGRLVFFRLARAPRTAETTGRTASNGFFMAFFMLVLVTAVTLAWRSVRRGRADTRSATRLAAAAGLFVVISHTFSSRHGLDGGEFYYLYCTFADALAFAAITGLTYLALEPFVRRRWPHGLVSWIRLINGERRDPHVGATVLVGLAFGCFYVVVEALHALLYGPAFAARYATLKFSSSPGRIAAGIFGYGPASALSSAFEVVFVLMVIYALVRRQWLAVCVYGVLEGSIQALGSMHPGLSASIFAPLWFLNALFTMRWGALAAVAVALIPVTTQQIPLTLDTSAWYFPASAALMVVIGALALWATRVALAGQPIWKED